MRGWDNRGDMSDPTVVYPAPRQPVPPPEGDRIDWTEGALHLKALHPEAMFLRILGVNYVHMHTLDEGDLYLTRWGIPFLPHLQPENWYEEEWFAQKRQRLHGTSTVYRMPTRPLPEERVKSIDIVVKWSRVGQEVDLNTFTMSRNLNAEFNSPFEEFALLEELRLGDYGPRELRIHTQYPLAIYVPPERLQPWQTGRSKARILTKAARHPGVMIDVLRAYILIYGWVKGVDAVSAHANSFYDVSEQHRRLQELTQRVDQELRVKGYVVADHKPTHFVLRMRGGQIRTHRPTGLPPYALVDFELLARTPDHEESVKRQARSEYLYRQRDRFLRCPREFPSYLKPANILGVDYVFGRSEATKGVVWVCGDDPELFPYFLPERWRTPPVMLTDVGQTFYAQTKDRIHLVWKVSRAGEFPPGKLDDAKARALLLQGYNAPFEEFAYAFEMARRGVKTIYPRAIYMTASPGEVAGTVLDSRPFTRMRELLSPEKKPVLPMDHDYVTIWGYWRGLEDDEAVTDNNLWTPIDAATARSKGLIDDASVLQILRGHEVSLRQAGFEDANLKPDHILLSYVPGGDFKRDSQGQLELRHCSFEMIRRLE